MLNSRVALRRPLEPSQDPVEDGAGDHAVAEDVAPASTCGCKTAEPNSCNIPASAAVTGQCCLTCRSADQLPSSRTPLLFSPARDRLVRFRTPLFPAFFPPLGLPYTSFSRFALSVAAVKCLFSSANSPRMVSTRAAPPSSSAAHGNETVPFTPSATSTFTTLRIALRNPKDAPLLPGSTSAPSSSTAMSQRGGSLNLHGNASSLRASLPNPPNSAPHTSGLCRADATPYQIATIGRRPIIFSRSPMCADAPPPIRAAKYATVNSASASRDRLFSRIRSKHSTAPSNILSRCSAPTLSNSK